jgi:uncharacterized membrane-anchored protein
MTIIFNGENYEITTEEDFDTIENTIHTAIENEEDINIDFIYPISITKEDNTEITINTRGEFDVLVDECYEDNVEEYEGFLSFYDSECMSLEYPVSFSIFNTNQETTETVTLNTKEELEDYLESIEEDFENGTIEISINYPLTLITAAGDSIEVNSDDEFKVAMLDIYAICWIENDHNLNVWHDENERLERFMSFYNSECISLEYPVSFSTFDANGDTIETVTVNNDEELNDYLESIEDDFENETIENIDMNYPVSLTSVEEETVEVNSYDELKETMANMYATCWVHGEQGIDEEGEDD